MLEEWTAACEVFPDDFYQNHDAITDKAIGYDRGARPRIQLLPLSRRHTPAWPVANAHPEDIATLMTASSTKGWDAHGANGGANER